MTKHYSFVLLKEKKQKCCITKKEKQKGHITFVESEKKMICIENIYIDFLITNYVYEY